MPINDRADDIANLLLRVYEIHEVAIAETGGLAGLRDATMLHSAVARPFATFDGQELYSTDFDKAAALFHSRLVERLHRNAAIHIQDFQNLHGR